MQFLLRAVFYLVLAMLMYEGMVTAFHLLNLPSNLAVVEGVCLLLFTAVGGVGAFVTIRKRR